MDRTLAPTWLPASLLLRIRPLFSSGCYRYTSNFEELFENAELFRCVRAPSQGSLFGVGL